MATAWYKPLREYAREGSKKHPSAYREDDVLFYLARWCQKEARKRKLGGASSPPLSSFEEKKLSEVGSKIAHNLSVDGKQVEVIFALKQSEYDELEQKLTAYTGSYGGGSAGQYTGDALLKVLPIVQDGTRPSCAGRRLERGVEGPNNEYVFQSPFLFWAGATARHLADDDRRERARLNKCSRDLILLEDDRRTSSPLERDERCDEVNVIVQEMMDVVDKLDEMPRSVMGMSMCRTNVDDEVHEHLHLLAPEVLGKVEDDIRLRSDQEIGDCLGTTRSNVATIRSNVRKDLAESDDRRGALLDYIFPHKSFR